MTLTGEQLRSLRISRDLTREELADFLGGCSASGVVKWESGISPVPEWVAEKMLRAVPIELPLEDMQELIEHARLHDIDFSTLLGQAIREYLAALLPKTRVRYTAAPASAALKVAEDPPPPKKPR